MMYDIKVQAQGKYHIFYLKVDVNMGYIMLLGILKVFSNLKDGFGLCFIRVLSQFFQTRNTKRS